MEWKIIQEYPLYEMCKETKEVRHVVTKRIKKLHGDSGHIRLYKDGKESSRKVDKLYFSTFPDTVEGVMLPNYSRYRVCRNGGIYSIAHAKFISSSVTKKGYLSVDLVTDDGTVGDTLAHRLVAKAFLPLIDGKDFVNHIDGDKANNDVSNLEWCTVSENNYHAVNTGLYASKMRTIKVSTDDGITWHNFASIVEASKFLGVDKSQVRNCAISNYTKEYNRGKPTAVRPFKVHGAIALYTEEPVKYSSCTSINNQIDK